MVWVPSKLGVDAVKHLQAGLALALLMFSRSYRQRWQQTIDHVDATLDAIAASNRRIEALEKGGQPKIRAVDAVSPRCL